MENRAIALIDAPLKTCCDDSTLTRHFDHLVRLSRVVDIPTIDKLPDAIQIGETRGRLLRCTVNHLVDGRFGQACVRPPGSLQNEGPGSAFATLFAIDLKLNQSIRMSRGKRGQSTARVVVPS